MLLDLSGAAGDDGQADDDPAQQAWELARCALAQNLILPTSPLLSCYRVTHR